MPGKTRRQRAKLSNQKKKNASREARPATVVKQPVAMDEEAPAVTITPRKTVTAPMVKPSVITHPYIASELWTIGTLAVIMLVILIVLALVIT